MRKFATAFTICLAIFVALNAGMYLLYARARPNEAPVYFRVGLPFTFWRKSPMYERFRPAALGADIVFALWVSYLAGRWREQRGKPDYVAGVKT
jgi:hypothetical protein